MLAGIHFSLDTFLVAGQISPLLSFPFRRLEADPDQAFQNFRGFDISDYIHFVDRRILRLLNSKMFGQEDRSIIKLLIGLRLLNHFPLIS